MPPRRSRKHSRPLRSRKSKGRRRRSRTKSVVKRRRYGAQREEEKGDPTVKWFHPKDENGIIPDFTQPRHYYAHWNDRHVVFRIEPSFTVVSRETPAQKDDDLHDLEPQEAQSVFDSLTTLDRDDTWIADTVARQLKMNPWQNPETILHFLFDLVNDSEAWGKKKEKNSLPKNWSKGGFPYPRTTLKWSFLQAFETRDKTKYDDLTTKMTQDEQKKIMEKVNESHFFVIDNLVTHLHLMSRVVDVYETGNFGTGYGAYRNIHSHCLTDPYKENSLPYPFKEPLGEDLQKAAEEHKKQIVAMLQGDLEYKIPEPYLTLRPKVVLGKCHYHWWNWYQNQNQ